VLLKSANAVADKGERKGGWKQPRERPLNRQRGFIYCNKHKKSKRDWLLKQGRWVEGRATEIVTWVRRCATRMCGFEIRSEFMKNNKPTPGNSRVLLVYPIRT
jgi:hypothetical protein